MSEQNLDLLSNDMQHIRNESFPHMYVVIDEIRSDIKAIFAQFATIGNRQAIVETKVDLVGKALWGIALTSMAAIGSIVVWLLTNKH